MRYLLIFLLAGCATNPNRILLYQHENTEVSIKGIGHGALGIFVNKRF